MHALESRLLREYYKNCYSELQDTYSKVYTELVHKGNNNVDIKNSKGAV